jgi:hypothetical protein
VALNTSGTGNFSKVTWLLNGPDANNIPGIYNASTNTLTFSSLSISVADKGSETYTVKAYYNNTGLIKGQTYNLSATGNNTANFTVAGSGSQMAGSQTAIANGATVGVTATKLVFGTQPAASISGVSMMQPVIRATDAAGNIDTGYTATADQETFALTAASGALTSVLSATFRRSRYQTGFSDSACANNASIREINELLLLSR